MMYDGNVVRGLWSLRLMADQVVEAFALAEKKSAGSGGNPEKKDWSDPALFPEIIEKYGSLVYNIARQSTRSDTEADDIAQEVFIKAWRSLPSFRGESSLSTWLGRITLNTCMDFARKRKRKPTISLTAFDEDDSDESRQLDIPDSDVSVSPETSAEKAETIALVRSAITALSEDQRTIIVLRDMEGYSYTEIAEMLGLELGTVKSRINRARQNIKEYLLKRNILD